MHQSAGYINPFKAEFVCKLTKALYGLKQAPQAWFDKLKVVLISLGFVNSKSVALYLCSGLEKQFLYCWYTLMIS